MDRKIARWFLGSGALLLAAGCGNTVTGLGDIAVAQDLAMPDLAVAVDLVAPEDLAENPDSVPSYSTTLMLQDVTTTTAGGMGPMTIHLMAAVVASPLPAQQVAYSFDNRKAGLGCFAENYNVAKGKVPPVDANLGRVVFSGYNAGLRALSGAVAPAEIDCIPDSIYYNCGWGALNGGVLGPPLSTLQFAANTTLIKPGASVRAMFMSGTNVGNFDSMAKLTSTDTLAVAEDLAQITYDASKDTTLHFTCPDGAGGACAANVVVVQLMATSVKSTDVANYPGAEFGIANCASLAPAGMATIPKGAIAAMFGTSTKLVEVMTRVVRAPIPPALTDSKGYPVTVLVGHGMMGFSPK